MSIYALMKMCGCVVKEINILNVMVKNQADSLINYI